MITQRDIDEARATQKACQRGFPKHMIDESNNLHAECYGTIGRLLKAIEEAGIVAKPEPFKERYPRGWDPDDEKPG